MRSKAPHRSTTHRPRLDLEAARLARLAVRRRRRDAGAARRSPRCFCPRRSRPPPRAPSPGCCFASSAPCAHADDCGGGGWGPAAAGVRRRRVAGARPPPACTAVAAARGAPRRRRRRRHLHVGTWPGPTPAGTCTWISWPVGARTSSARRRAVRDLTSINMIARGWGARGSVRLRLGRASGGRRDCEKGRRAGSRSGGRAGKWRTRARSAPRPTSSRRSRASRAPSPVAPTPTARQARTRTSAEEESSDGAGRPGLRRSAPTEQAARRGPWLLAAAQWRIEEERRLAPEQGLLRLSADELGLVLKFLPDVEDIAKCATLCRTLKLAASRAADARAASAPVPLPLQPGESKLRAVRWAEAMGGLAPRTLAAGTATIWSFGWRAVYWEAQLVGPAGTTALPGGFNGDALRAHA